MSLAPIPSNPWDAYIQTHPFKPADLSTKILDCICSHISSKKDLLEFSLVHPNWFPSGILALWEFPFFSHPEALFSFIKLVSQKKGLFHLSRGFDLTYNPLPADSKLVPSSTAFLVNDILSQQDPDPLLFYSSDLASSVFADPQILVNLIRASRAINKLSFYGYNLLDTHLSSLSLSAQSLTSLEIIGAPSSSLNAFAQLFSSFTSLESLSLKFPNQSIPQQLWKSVSVYAARLKHLEIWIDNCKHDITPILLKTSKLLSLKIKGSNIILGETVIPQIVFCNKLLQSLYIQAFDISVPDFYAVLKSSSFLKSLFLLNNSSFQQPIKAYDIPSNIAATRISTLVLSGLDIPPKSFNILFGILKNLSVVSLSQIPKLPDNSLIRLFQTSPSLNGLRIHDCPEITESIFDSLLKSQLKSLLILQISSITITNPTHVESTIKKISSLQDTKISGDIKIKKPWEFSLSSPKNPTILGSKNSTQSAPQPSNFHALSQPLSNDPFKSSLKPEQDFDEYDQSNINNQQPFRSNISRNSNFSYSSRQSFQSSNPASSAFNKTFSNQSLNSSNKNSSANFNPNSGFSQNGSSIQKSKFHSSNIPSEQLNPLNTYTNQNSEFYSFNDRIPSNNNLLNGGPNPKPFANNNHDLNNLDSQNIGFNNPVYPQFQENNSAISWKSLDEFQNLLGSAYSTPLNNNVLNSKTNILPPTSTNQQQSAYGFEQQVADNTPNSDFKKRRIYSTSNNFDSQGRPPQQMPPNYSTNQTPSQMQPNYTNGRFPAQPHPNYINSQPPTKTSSNYLNNQPFPQAPTVFPNNQPPQPMNTNLLNYQQPQQMPSISSNNQPLFKNSSGVDHIQKKILQITAQNQDESNKLSSDQINVSKQENSDSVYGSLSQIMAEYGSEEKPKLPKSLLGLKPKKPGPSVNRSSNQQQLLLNNTKPTQARADNSANNESGNLMNLNFNLSTESIDKKSLFQPNQTQVQQPYPQNNEYHVGSIGFEIDGSKGITLPASLDLPKKNDDIESNSSDTAEKKVILDLSVETVNDGRQVLKIYE
ncbi:hypothetical protein BB560_002811 [Smittium megazygosporum]|uniref:Uncharacterized protein n=1 Tax=Smittium megazygosporum TaxID=133381 RepID=A0A2T9ZDP6_9FUNG|nr:hypothetical protein BB560_002811 [Smittium megazygosporum]